MTCFLHLAFSSSTSKIRLVTKIAKYKYINKLNENKTDYTGGSIGSGQVQNSDFDSVSGYDPELLAATGHQTSLYHTDSLKVSLI